MLYKCSLLTYFVEESFCLWENKVYLSTCEFYGCVFNEEVLIIGVQMYLIFPFKHEPSFGNK